MNLISERVIVSFQRRRGVNSELGIATTCKSAHLSSSEAHLYRLLGLVSVLAVHRVADTSDCVSSRLDLPTIDVMRRIIRGALMELKLTLCRATLLIIHHITLRKRQQRLQSERLESSVAVAELKLEAAARSSVHPTAAPSLTSSGGGGGGGFDDDDDDDAIQCDRPPADRVLLGTGGRLRGSQRGGPRGAPDTTQPR